jgi:hypothetical protein
MSEIKVNKISQRSGTAITLGNSGTDFQLPSGAEIVAQSGSTITIASGATITNSGTATGFGATGAVNWDTTKKTTGFTSVSGNGYFCDTTSSAFTATLPATPSAGDIVAFSDYTGTWETNNLTVGRNGSNINASATDLILNANNTTATFIYVDGTEGWRIIDTGSLSEVNVPLYVSATGGTITTCGNYKIHSFTGPGTFTVSSAGNSLGSNSVDYLVVAGGAGGGADGGGGGGAGGFRESKATGAPWTASPLASSTSLPVTATAYPITVGAGGPAPNSLPGVGISGNPSIFSTITSAGGGGAGGQYGPSSPTNNGTPGGAGGGVGRTDTTPCKVGAGAGNSPPVSPPQGQPGGPFSPNPAFAGGSGGGGAIVAGTSGSPSQGGPGGNGATTSISGSPTAYAGGGGGATWPTGGSIGTGGTGGGANGSSYSSPATPATANTGGGGGGGAASGQLASNGGSGIVVIRYKFQ